MDDSDENEFYEVPAADGLFWLRFGLGYFFIHPILICGILMLHLGEGYVALFMAVVPILAATLLVLPRTRKFGLGLWISSFLSDLAVMVLAVRYVAYVIH